MVFTQFSVPHRYIDIFKKMFWPLYRPPEIYMVGLEAKTSFSAIFLMSLVTYFSGVQQ